MSGHPDRASARAIIQNLRKPMPLGRKMVTYWSNIWIRVRHRRRCCGHPGEPGC